MTNQPVEIMEHIDAYLYYETCGMSEYDIEVIWDKYKLESNEEE